MNLFLSIFPCLPGRQFGCLGQSFSIVHSNNLGMSWECKPGMGVPFCVSSELPGSADAVGAPALLWAGGLGCWSPTARAGFPVPPLTCWLFDFEQVTCRIS